MIIVASFSERLRDILGEKGLTVTELGERIGISKQAVSTYLTGKRSPKRPTIEALSRELNVSPAWLIGYDVSKELERPIQKDEPLVDPVDEQILEGLKKLTSRDKAAIIAQITALSQFEDGEE